MGFTVGAGLGLAEGFSVGLAEGFGRGPRWERTPAQRREWTQERGSQRGGDSRWGQGRGSVTGVEASGAGEVRLLPPQPARREREQHVGEGERGKTMFHMRNTPFNQTVTGSGCTRLDAGLGSKSSQKNESFYTQFALASRPGRDGKAVRCGPRRNGAVASATARYCI